LFDHRIIITTGDVDGIGLEVSLKALLSFKKQLGRRSRIQFILMKGVDTPRFLLPLYRRILSFANGLTFPSLPTALLSPSKCPLLIVANSDSPADWVSAAGHACLKKMASAIVTAPLSKTEIKSAGYRAVGHTDILQKICKAKHVFMAFLGNHFSVLLVTGHVALKDVHKHLTLPALRMAVLSALQLRQQLSGASKFRPIALVGVNPHAGEKSIIGSEESTLYKKIFTHLSRGQSSKNICGPLVPDVCFQPTQWHKYSVYVAPYHDQGLIPFKLVHGQESGVHATIGLPFVRTSVDHGTAKDIFGKNVASPKSMTLALHWAIKLLKEVKNGI